MTVDSYRFYFKDDDQTFAADVLECDGDGDAVEKARQLLLTSRFETMEIWQGERKVGTIERDSS